MNLRSLAGIPLRGHDKETSVPILDRLPPPGLIVDMVGEVKTIPGTAIEPVPTVAGIAGKDSLYRGIAKLPDRVIILMDLKKNSASPDEKQADCTPAAAVPALHASTAAAPATGSAACGDAGLMLTEFHLDALREMGSIGTSHSATSLSHLVCSTIHISVPAIKLEKINRISGFITDEKVVGLLLEIRKDERAAGYMYTMFPEKSAFRIVDALMGQPPDTTKAIGEVEQSAIMEVGNILASSFCDAVAGLLDIVLLPSPPSFVCDMASAIVQDSLIAIGQVADDVIIFHTEFADEQRNYDGYVILFPNPEMLDRILSILEAKANP